MRHSFRWVRFVVAGLLAVLVAEAETPAGADADFVQLSPDEANAPWVGDLDGMIARRAIRVLTPYNGIFYYVTGEKRRGVSYEAFHLFEESLNRRLLASGRIRNKNLPVQVVFVPVPRDELIPALLAGKGDVVAADLTVTAERRRVVAFSRPVDDRVSEVLVTSANVPGPADANGLSGRPVFVRPSSSPRESLEALNRRLAQAGLAPADIRPVPDAMEDEDIMDMVGDGMLPCTVMDRSKALFWKQVYPEVRVHEDIVLRSGGVKAWAVRPGSPLLLAELNAFLKEHGPHTLTRNLLLRRYFTTADRVRNAAFDKETAKFDRTRPFFEKYGKRYEIDWLMLAAQGYQESGLDQGVVSRAGAVGVMQLMPATGRELAVGDIRETEANIHAGVKYMRRILDRHFADEGMTRENRVLFALAAYNAGPARIGRLRAEAAARGLDRDRWFGHVETLAAERIGRETVSYVRNIYKYYLGYRLLLEAREARAAGNRELAERLGFHDDA